MLFLTACAGTPKRTIASGPEGSNLPMVPALLAKTFQGPFLVNPEGATRAAAKVYLPLEFAKKESWPLVVLLHGFSGTAEIEDTYLMMRYRVSSRGFILLTPDGSALPKGTTTPDGGDVSGLQFWNATDFCCDFKKTNVDDVGYLSKLIETVKLKYNVDPDRIYIFGHSNGGFMANRLACEMGGQIAGIASLAGGTFADAGKCRAPTPVAYLQIHAEDDRKIPFENGPPEMAGGRLTVQQWTTKNGCAGSSRKTLEQDFLFFAPGNDTKQEIWTNCKSGKPVAFWTINTFENEHHNPHIPVFNYSFGEKVLDFLLEQRL